MNRSMNGLMDGWKDGWMSFFQRSLFPPRKVLFNSDADWTRSMESEYGNGKEDIMWVYPG